ncbi:DUF305 domain-containing protein [Corynebacterium sp.]|uniref:DUF305 domain-containing protein n=1 Tax=Corynebacterium sp. TaxID=1720 RepID=UPI0026DD63F4|nr:DUF305 domain-containing protein [Corynebacterium sp.]MDO4610400.1 DUF305 domain-containing protein [Corynebacterium sp.]
MKRIALLSLLLAPSLALAACGDDAADAPSGTAGAPDSPGATAEQESRERISAEHNDADVRFARMMIPHHEQALEMSRILLAKDGVPPRAVEMATGIQNAQGPEIATLHAMLDAWGESDVPGGDEVAGEGGPEEHPAEPAPSDAGAAPETDAADPHADHDHADGAHEGHGQMDPSMHGEEAAPQLPADDGGHVMAGMLTPDQLAAIEAAPGPEAARLYLEGMIAHHQGAVDMAREELDGGSNEQAKKLARSIIDTQESEIAAMREILDQL